MRLGVGPRVRQPYSGIRNWLTLLLLWRLMTLLVFLTAVAPLRGSPVSTAAAIAGITNRPTLLLGPRCLFHLIGMRELTFLLY